MTEPVIHIGYHKTGTTWLQRRLFARKDLGYRRIRLQQDGVELYHVHDFDFDPGHCRAQLTDELEACAREGAIPVVSMERLSGNPHSGGYDSRTLADRILAVFPDARVLIGIREQRSMILSCYGQYVKAGGPCSLRRYLHAPQDGRRPGFRFEHLQYDRLIAHYQSALGRERVHVACYERFRDEPDGWLQDVAAFCGGKAPTPEAEAVVLNPSLGPVALSVLRWLDPFVHPDSLNGWSPYAIPWLQRPARALASGIDRIAPGALQDAIRRRWQRIIVTDTAGRYEASNRRTAELTGLDLGRWGYRI
ncbi:MAG: sulfotransferase [Myxococcota bacterium]